MPGSAGTSQSLLGCQGGIETKGARNTAVIRITVGREPNGDSSPAAWRSQKRLQYSGLPIKALMTSRREVPPCSNPELTPDTAETPENAVSRFPAQSGVRRRNPAFPQIQRADECALLVPLLLGCQGGIETKGARNTAVIRITVGREPNGDSSPAAWRSQKRLQYSGLPIKALMTSRREVPPCSKLTQNASPGASGVRRRNPRYSVLTNSSYRSCP